MSFFCSLSFENVLKVKISDKREARKNITDRSSNEHRHRVARRVKTKWRSQNCNGHLSLNISFSKWIEWYFWAEEEEEAISFLSVRSRDVNSFSSHQTHYWSNRSIDRGRGRKTRPLFSLPNNDQMISHHERHLLNIQVVLHWYQLNRSETIWQMDGIYICWKMFYWKRRMTIKEMRWRTTKNKNRKKPFSSMNEHLWRLIFHFQLFNMRNSRKKFLSLALHNGLAQRTNMI